MDNFFSFFLFLLRTRHANLILVVEARSFREKVGESIYVKKKY